MNYAVFQRLRMIDFLLDHFGYAGPIQICDYFGISRPAASLDFVNYNKLHPGNMEYMYSSTRWVRTAEFERAYP